MRFGDKVKIIYLLMVILFSLGVFAYLLDTWGIIRLDRHLPFLSKEPPLVSDETDSISELEAERFAKEEERLRELELTVKEAESKLEQEKEELRKKTEELEELKAGLEAEKAKIEEDRAAENERKKMISDMAGRISGMPPQSAVSILEGWSNTDVVDVFLRMEQISADEGRPSIVPYLLTLMPKERAALITSLMMDEEARRVPR